MAKTEETMNLHINISPDEYENLVQYDRLLTDARAKAASLSKELERINKLAKEVQDSWHISAS